MNYLEAQSLLSPQQAGFRPRRSTTSQLVESTGHYLELFKNGGSFDVIYFDFQKAFDSLDHRFLIHKLKTFGIQNPVLRWLENFLSDRKQSVVIDESFSALVPITSGVPQGSCLGPILFILYINDIGSRLPKTIRFGMYADDIKIYGSTRFASDLQLAIDLIHEWSEEWNMNLSQKKCCVMHFGPLKSRTSFTLNEHPLAVVEEVKDLGVLMNPKLHFDAHINAVVRKASARINNIFRIFKTTSMPLLLKSFKIFVRPLLESNTEIWNPTLSGLTRALESVQRTFTRRLLSRAGTPHLPYTERLRILNLQSLELRRATKDLTFLYKAINSTVDFDSSALFRFGPSHRTLRGGNSKKIALPFRIYGIKRSSCASRMISVWNSLPNEIIFSFSSFIFNKKLHGLTINSIVPNSFVVD